MASGSLRTAVLQLVTRPWAVRNFGRGAQLVHEGNRTSSSKSSCGEAQNQNLQARNGILIRLFHNSGARR